MKILIDCRFASQSVGLGRYTRELVMGLLLLPSKYTYELLLADGPNNWLQNAEHIVTYTTKSKHYSLGEQREYRTILAKSKPDLLFVPHFNVPLFSPVPFVCTVHDLILHHYPNQASLLKRMAYRVLMRYAVQYAQRIVAVSNYTKQDILKEYGAKIAQKTVVITESVPENMGPSTQGQVSTVKTTLDIHSPYFLYVGNAKAHKNVPFLIQSFLAADVAASLVLVCADQALIQVYSNNPSIIFVPSVNDATLQALYTGAQALVTASLYEGFCLPIIEARACNCPIIATNCTAIPELAAKDTLLLEPVEQEYVQAFRGFILTPKSQSTSSQPSWIEIAQEVESLFTQSL